MKYIKSLDTLRAFAVIFVLIGHWELPIKFGPTGQWLFTGVLPAPSFGVNLFFVLSGFLITGILLDARASGESKLRIMRSFVARRTLRIFPIYYLAVFVLVLLGYPFIKEHLVWFLTYTSNILVYKQASWNPWVHTWSLSVEEQFYLFWPWIILYVNQRYLKYVFYLSLFIGFVSTLLVRAQTPPNMFALDLTPACMQAFGIGGLYAYLRRGEDQVRPFMRIINWLLPFALVVHFYWGFAPYGGHFNYWNRTVDSVLSIWLIHYAIAARPGWIKSRVLENPVLVKIGRISYGIYLYHFAIPRLYEMAIKGSPANSMLRDPFVGYGIELVVLFALCIASFEFIEKPVLRLKRFFEYKKDGAPVAGKEKPARVYS